MLSEYLFDWIDRDPSPIPVSLAVPHRRLLTAGETKRRVPAEIKSARSPSDLLHRPLPGHRSARRRRQFIQSETLGFYLFRGAARPAARETSIRLNRTSAAPDLTAVEIAVARSHIFAGS
ncbi:hypothetical protein EVAR_95680_1 [Eumeta japonica]|uniref:Uncharacterized protein n=1 Tax=Eumeta variegata TaxID=151549 RepID=A0A4C1VK58_EUMVA|nr:hypothetical protein EVAR_95680_1 [Eumeta japonica]